MDKYFAMAKPIGGGLKVRVELNANSPTQAKQLMEELGYVEKVLHLPRKTKL